MKTAIISTIAALGLALSSISAANTFGPLVTPAELSAQLEQATPIILDIRGELYAKAHIPGAVSAPYGLFRGPKKNPGQMLEAAVLEERFEALGLEIERPIVIVPVGKTDTDFGAAARVYWTLKTSGFTDLSILNGGAIAWETAGLPVDNDLVTPVPTELSISLSNDWTANTDQVAAVARGEVDALLLDARTDPFFQGDKAHPAAARPGTLPGAENFAYTSFFNNGSVAMSEISDTPSLLEKLGVEDGEDVVSFCNTGHWAATNWFALSEVAGIENVKLFPGSMVEYSNTDHEMENTPGILKHFLNKIKGN